MEIWQLNTFIVVAKNLHITRAAKELKITQSAVSQQIKSLENELGVELFHREKKQISLTSQGRKVLEFAQKILRQVEMMQQEIKNNKDTLSGKIKIVAVPRSLNSPFYKIKNEFENKYPDIQLFFEAVTSSELIFEYIKKGISDIGITTEKKNFQGLTPIPYGSFEMMLLVGKNHRLVGRGEVELKELSEEKWILFEEGSWLRRISDEIFEKQDFEPENITETTDGATIFLTIADSAAIGFLPKWGILDGLEEHKVVPLKIKNINARIPLNLIVSPVNHSRLVSVLVDFLLQKQFDGIDINF